jgi:hypothetical protein
MNVPARGGWGRANATVPLAELTIDDEWVTLRPRWFAALMVGPFRVPLAAVVGAYPLRGRALASGIGLTTSDEQTAYFWTWRDQAEVLRSLADRGVAVDPSPRRPTAVWRLRSAPRTLTQVASIRPGLVRIMPFTMGAGTVVAVILETVPAPVWWRAWVAVIWVIGLITTFRTWRNARRPD